jgi:hypothetical protein
MTKSQRFPHAPEADGHEHYPDDTLAPAREYLDSDLVPHQQQKKAHGDHSRTMAQSPIGHMPGSGFPLGRVRRDGRQVIRSRKDVKKSGEKRRQHDQHARRSI